jgi:demethylmenaquinone methyltransferase/2-methoxy-6-polyprenyl-1,4-benzoquinol methylase
MGNIANTKMQEYYARRAPEYERIYRKPERQNDLRMLETVVTAAVAGRSVLELACGTGFWTERLAAAARQLTAIDSSPETLEIARHKACPPGRVAFQEADCFHLGDLRGTFDAGLAMFWWSHIPRAGLRSFLEHFNSPLAPGAWVFFADKRIFPGSSTEISRTDAEGNTFQLRTLQNGEQFEVIKNFPSVEELTFVLSEYSTAFTTHLLEYYWCVVYRLRDRSHHFNLPGRYS